MAPCYLVGEGCLVTRSQKTTPTVGRRKIPPQHPRYVCACCVRRENHDTSAMRAKRCPVTRNQKTTPTVGRRKHPPQHPQGGMCCDRQERDDPGHGTIMPYMLHTDKRIRSHPLHPPMSMLRKTRMDERGRLVMLGNGRQVRMSSGKAGSQPKQL